MESVLAYIREKEGHSDCDSKRSVHQVDHPPSSEEAQATGTTDKPAKAKRIKRSVSRKTRQSRSSLKSVGESKAEEVPAEEPQIADEDADFQKAVEESMKDAYALPKGPLPPAVIREPESKKYQPLPEVSGKGKAKMSEEQVAHDLLSLQKHKKTSHADQYIFQRRVFEPTASSFHDVSLYEILGQSVSEDESKKIVLGVEKGGQDEGQAGSNPDETSEGQAGPDPGNAEARVQSTSSHVVHARSDREHMDIDVANLSPQPSTEQLYEGFIATVYPNVQENLKLAVEEPVFNNHRHNNNNTTTLPPPQAPQQSTIEAMMVKRIGELEHTLADLIQVNKTMEERLDKHGEHLCTLEQLDIPQQVSIAVRKLVTDAVDWAMQAPPRNRFRDLPEANMKEILHQRMWETDSYKSYEDHTQLFEALEKSINRDQSEELAHDLAEVRKKGKRVASHQKRHMGHHPISHLILLHQRVHLARQGLLELPDPK
nr:hypothetical protein [Tanacetum cinerariifolium]